MLDANKLKLARHSKGAITIDMLEEWPIPKIEYWLAVSCFIDKQEADALNRMSRK